ncbi:hypothetical protein ACOSQ3_023878 [Xanthoceras sorbifolium]
MLFNLMHGKYRSFLAISYEISLAHLFFLHRETEREAFTSQLGFSHFFSIPKYLLVKFTFYCKHLDIQG